MVDFSYKPGKRAVKTSIAVFLCMVIAILLRRENLFYSSIAAAVCLQQNYKQTFSLGINRLVGTLIGGAVGYGILQASLHIPGYNNLYRVIVVPIMLLLVIYLCNVLGKSGAIPISCIVFLSIVANSNREIDSAFLYVLDRVIDTGIGVVSAMIIDRFVLGGYEAGQGKETDNNE